MSLIDRWDVTLETRVDKSDRDVDPYGRNDKITHVNFQEGVDCDEFASRRSYRWVDEDFDDHQERAMKYAVSRIGSISELWNTSHYTAEIRNGYYGDEIAGIRHTYENKIRNRIEKCRGFVEDGMIREMVEQLLTWEYGYVLDEIKKGDFSEEKLHISDLYTPNRGYAGKVDPSEYTVSTQWPIGVYLDREVIDGYNRYITLKGEAEEVFIYNFCS